MSHQAGIPSLHLHPGTSWRLAGYLILIHGLTLGVVWYLPLTGPWRFLLGLGVLFSLALGLGGPVWHRWPWDLSRAVWHADGRWTLTLGSGREVEGRLLGSSFVSPALVVLNFRQGRWRTRSLVLLPDNLDPNLLRQLRARLRLAGRQGGLGH